MRSAALTIILPGSSSGVRWEVSFALRNIQPSRLVVLVPAKLPLYADFLQHTSQDLPHALPPVEEITSQSDFWINRFSQFEA